MELSDYDCSAPVVVHLAKELDHGGPALVELGVGDLHPESDVLQYCVRDVRGKPVVILHQPRQQRGHVPDVEIPGGSDIIRLKLKLMDDILKVPDVLEALEDIVGHVGVVPVHLPHLSQDLLRVALVEISVKKFPAEDILNSPDSDSS